MRTTAFLRYVPVLSGLDDELLERLAQQIREVHVSAGDWIMREGGDAESLFIVRSGRVEVIDEGPPESLIRVLRRGDVLGEPALLRQGKRSASVRAMRDSELLELGRGPFEELIQGAPSFALGLTRALGAQLAASRAPIVGATPPRAIALVALDDRAVTADIADGLARELARFGSVTVLRDSTLASIDQAERQNDRVLLDGGAASGDEGWIALCLREADLVLAVTTGTPSAAWRARATALGGCELLVRGPAIDGSVIAVLQPRETQVVANPAHLSDALAATARRFAGRSLGIVLSGGGARALAHLGVLEELAAIGVLFDRIAGVSLGSLVAAATAAGHTTEAMREGFERSFVETNPSNDFVVPAYSLIRGAKTRRLLREYFGERRIEELPLRFFCLSCDLIGREAVIHRTGPVVDAVYPSLAIPGVFPPVPTTDGRLLVDGGVLDNLPVAAMARAGQGPVIAVDVTDRMGAFSRPDRGVTGRIGRPVRMALTGSDAEVPRLGETLVRTMMVGSTDTVAAARLHADLVITPQVDGIGLMDWKSLSRVRELGRQAARDVLQSNPDIVRQWGV
jgi:NTE family protein